MSEERNLGVRVAFTNVGGEQVQQSVRALGAELGRVQSYIRDISANQTSTAQAALTALRAEEAALLGKLSALGRVESATNSLASSTAKAARSYVGLGSDVREVESSINAMTRALQNQGRVAVGTATEVAASFSAIEKFISRSRAADLAAAPAMSVALARAGGVAPTFTGRQMSSAEILAAQRRVRAMQPPEEESGGLSAIQPQRIISLTDQLMRHQTGGAFATMGAALKDIGVSGVVATAAIGAFVTVAAAEGIARGAENMGKFARETMGAAAAAGMSYSQFAGLQGAMETMGIKSETANRALVHFAEITSKAIAGDPKSLEYFNNLGISFERLKQTGGDTGQALMLVADAMKGHASNANLAANAAGLFGVREETLIQALREGSIGLQEAEDRAKALGIVLDQSTAEAAAKTGDKVRELGLAIRGDAMQAMVAWGPVIEGTIGLLERLGSVASTAMTGLSYLAKPQPSISSSGFVDPSSGVFVPFPPTSAQANTAPWGTSGREGRRFGGAGLPSAGAVVTPESIEQRMQDAIQLAGTQASRGGGKPAQLHLAETQAELSALRKFQAENADLLSKQDGAREGAKRRELELERQVNNEKASIAASEAKAGETAAHKEYTGTLDEQKAGLRELQRERQLDAQLQAGQFDKARLQARQQRADKDLSPIAAAREEYNAYKTSSEQKLADLEKFKSQSNTAYDAIIAEAEKVYGQDAQHYRAEVQDKIAADKQFATEHQQIENEITNAALKLAAVHQQEVQKVIAAWGNAFDKIGDQIETTIGTAIKSAFEPMKPEYWWSSVQGPHGQPLMQAHRIDPTTQLLGGLGMNVLGDLGKQLGTSVSESLAKSLSGGAASSFGQLIAKSIGIGSPGGLAGTGLGAVSAVDTMTQTATQTSLLTSIAVNTGGILSNTAATLAVQSSGAGASTVSAAGSAGGIIGGIKAIGGFLGGLFERGGIVPSAAGGFMTPNVAGGMLSILHAREMVLPADVTSKVLAGSSGPDVHMHFHGPADAPSMDRWFRNMMTANPGAIRSMLRNNSLTPRNL